MIQPPGGGDRFGLVVTVAREATMTYQARVTDDGSLALPDELAREFGLRPGDVLSIERDGRALVLTREGETTPLSRLRDALKGYSVDQFLAERGADWSE